MSNEPIAVVGMGCRFPGADSPEEFWELLCNGVDRVGEVPRERWDPEQHHAKDRGKILKSVSRWGGFVNGVDQFDAPFFGISPREAAFLDPQQRLLLEVVWEAFEDGGIVPKTLSGSRTAVYIGGFSLDYYLLAYRESNRELVGPHTTAGTMMTMLAARVAYTFNLQGPTVSVDTACSSSLVATHLACQSIWNGESDMAIAGGVNLLLSHDLFMGESKAGMLSPTGRSKAFDASADGYVRGEGVGVVLLKPLSKALADGDQIYSIIRSTAVNQDGQTPGITVPSGDAQQKLMHEAYSKAGIKPSEIQYVEAHGTGTPVGDPIEANAIGAVVSEGRRDGQECYISSLKTNIGHTEAAAGIAGLIKTSLMLKHKKIPPHLHLKNPNPDIRFDQWKMIVPTSLLDWPATDGPARAGVNSFGFGGTNAHVVLEEAPHTSIPNTQEQTPTDQSSRIPHLLPISARSSEALLPLASKYRQLVSGSDTPKWKDILFTATHRREHSPHRLAAVVHGPEDLLECMEAFENGEARTGLFSGAAQARQKIAFMFTGMGPQWWAMGQQLYAQEPVFRAAADEIDEMFVKHAGFSIVAEMLADESTSQMEETKIAQPANFVIQVALAKLWQFYGIQPDAVVGHSAGEVASAYLAGVMNLDDACKVIYHRSRLQQLTTGQGKLVAVGLSLDQAKQAIRGYEDRVSIAAVNSPSAVTLVGDVPALDEVVKPLQEQSVFVRFLHVKVPYHSHYMNVLEDEMLDVLSGLDLKSATVPLFSTVTGQGIDGKEMDAAYWFKNVREPVYCAAAVTEMIKEGYTLFVEVGPHPVLVSSIKECLQVQDKQGIVVPSLRRGEPERAMMLGSLGQLFTLGFDVQWENVNRVDGALTKLPTYPWQRERLWIESELSMADRTGGDFHPLLGHRISASTPTWEKDLDNERQVYLADHEIQNQVVFPGAGYFEMALAVAQERFGTLGAVTVQDLSFKKALFLPDASVKRTQTTLDETDGSFRISSRELAGKTWVEHASGKVRPKNGAFQKQVNLADIQGRCGVTIEQENLYRQFHKLGLVYGPAFQGIAKLSQGENEALSQLQLPEIIEKSLDQYCLHPAVLDFCLQTMAGTLKFPEDDKDATVFLPTGIDEAVYYGRLADQMWVHSKLVSFTGNELLAEVRLLDESGNVLVELLGCRAKSLNAEQTLYKTPGFYEFNYVAQELLPTEGDSAVGNWLIFADREAVGQQLCELLQAGGSNVLMVQAGDVKDNQFDELIQQAGGQQLRGVVYLGALDIASSAQLTNADLYQAEQLGCLPVMKLVQALSKVEWRHAPQLWLATRGSQQVGDTPLALNVAQTSLWGLARVIGHQEHTDIWGGIVDLDPVASTNDATQLLAEIVNKGQEDQIAYHGGVRHVARLQDSGNLTAALSPQFRADGSYLITGGFGGLGLLVARYLVEHGARRLILVGRSDFPSRSEWNQAEAGSSLAERIAAVRELEALGASVHITGFDIADEAALQAFLNQYEAEGWPAIRGIIHAAGVAKPQILVQMTDAEFQGVARPKINGAWNLHRAFAGRELDFFVLFSSVAATVTSIGQANYSAANSFMDALAHYRRSQNLPGLSINWGPWAEVGMAEKLNLTEFFEQRGNYPISLEYGLSAFGSLLEGNRGNVVVIATDWKVAAQKNYPFGVPTMIDELLAADETAGADNSQAEENALEALLAVSDPVERRNKLNEVLKGFVADAIRLNQSKVSLDTPLNALGLDSMLAMELRSHLEKGLSVNITVVDLLQGPSISMLADKFMLQLSEMEQLAGSDEALLAEMEGLSEEEVLAMLREVAIGKE